jgi:hypothetical protein
VHDRDELAAHREQGVVLICRSGNRAEQAETVLTSSGLPNLHVVDGRTQRPKSLASSPLLAARCSGVQEQRWFFGTPLSTCSTCWPQPA